MWKSPAMERRVAMARLAAGGRRLAAPKKPKVAKAGPAGVTLKWTAPFKKRE